MLQDETIVKSSCLLISLLTSLALVSCGGSTTPAGSERGPCYGNKTCDPGLTCASDVCVKIGTGGSGGGAGNGGAGGGTGAAGRGGMSGESGRGGSAGGTSQAGAGGGGIGGGAGAGGSSPGAGGGAGNGGSAGGIAGSSGGNAGRGGGGGGGVAGGGGAGTGGGGTGGGGAGTGGAAGASAGPHCAGVPATCGENGNSDCCSSAMVPGGMFNRSSDSNAPAMVSVFRMDNYEISVARFRAFVAGYPANKPAAGSGKNPNNAADPGWDAAWNSSMLPADAPALVTAIKCHPTYMTWTDTPGGNEKRPINCVSWYEALAFCIWDGGRLPTEAEWNFAAAGGDEQRPYPWWTSSSGQTIDETYASYFLDGTRQCFGDGLNGCAVTDFIPVGSKPKGNGKWGQSDLAGNVHEWVVDYFHSYTSPCVDCANLSAGARVFRGGSAQSSADQLMGGYRNYGGFVRDPTVGARCVRMP